MSYTEDRDRFLAACPVHTLSAGGGTFQYIRAGNPQGPDLVFLNGGTNAAELWLSWADYLADDFHLLFFDYPRAFPDHAALIPGMHSFFDALGVRKPVLIGASYGGMNAQLYARQYPEEVEALVLLSTGGMDKISLRTLKRKYFFGPLMLAWMKHCRYEKLKPKLIQGGMRHAAGETPERQAYAREMFTALFADYTREKDVHATGLLLDLLKQTPVTPADFDPLDGRVLLVLPDRDFFSPDLQNKLVSLFTRPQVVRIQGGHIATVLRPEEYAGLVRRFLAGLGLGRKEDTP